MGLVALGTFILWFGFYGFNCGSTLYMNSSAKAMEAGLVAMNTTMSAAMGGLTVFTVRFIIAKINNKENQYDLAGACNGILAGLVAVCAGVGSVEPHGALLIGIVGGLAEELGSNLCKKLGVDDPLDAFAVHGCGGISGLLLAPLVKADGPSGDMFVAHIVGILAIIGWSGGLSAATFGVLQVLGQLRIPLEEENNGCDVKLAQQFHSPPKHYAENNDKLAQFAPPVDDVAPQIAKV